jgi:hypothetical protein
MFDMERIVRNIASGVNARMDAHRPLKIGETIEPSVCISQARFFDSGSGERIGSLSGQGTAG